jgi:hypothetical protein
MFAHDLLSRQYAVVHVYIEQQDIATDVDRADQRILEDQKRNGNMSPSQNKLSEPVLRGV